MARETLPSSTPSGEQSSNWYPYADLWIHNGLFEKGILAIKQRTVKSKLEDVIENDCFPIKERKFYFSLSEKEKSEMRDKGLPFESRPVPDIREVRRTQNLLEKVTGFSDIVFSRSTPVVFNSERREEVFSPLVIGDRGIYVFPWLSQNSKIFENESAVFSGFKQFVTAGCLFGSSLRGEDQHGNPLPIFKHDIPFFAGQKIDTIVFDVKGPNPYEKMLFKEFEVLVSMIDKFSDPSQPKRLLYHLPSYDYVLFSVELFIRGRITLGALNVLFEQIFLTRDRHIKKISAICAQHGIEATIASPFDNLFVALNNHREGFTEKTPVSSTDTASLEARSEGGADLHEIHASLSDTDSIRTTSSEELPLAPKILNILGISNEEDLADIDRIENEKKLLQYCLVDLLQTSGHGMFNADAHRVWQDFLKPENFKDVKNLEDLFKIANAVMIAIGAIGKSDYETCSMLPISEKQIQVQYKSLAKKHAYPQIFNLTILDVILAYNAKNHGPLYYFNYCDESLSGLIKKKDILSHAHKNIGFFANSGRGDSEKRSETTKIEDSSPISLESILSDLSRANSATPTSFV